MGKTTKKHVTRPDFLLTMMGGDVAGLDNGSLKHVLKDTDTLCHVVYTVLMEADIRKSDIVAVHNDGESIAITMGSKKLAAEARERCHKKTVRYGSHKYRVKLKARDKYLIAECEEEDE